MKKLKMNPSQLVISNHEWIADLLYYDGPIISLYKGSDGYFYLYCWSEVDATHHRWIIAQIDVYSLQRYIRGEITLKKILTSPLNGALYLIDEDDDGNHDQVYTLDPSDLPASYIPADDSYFTDDELSKDHLDMEINILKAIRTFNKKHKIGYLMD